MGLCAVVHTMNYNMDFSAADFKLKLISIKKIEVTRQFVYAESRRILHQVAWTH